MNPTFLFCSLSGSTRRVAGTLAKRPGANVKTGVQNQRARRLSDEEIERAVAVAGEPS